MKQEHNNIIRITPPNRYQNMSAAGFFLSLLSVLIIVGIVMNEHMGANWLANLTLALLLGLAGLAMMTTKGGAEVDVVNKRVRHFSKTLGLQSGKWQSLEKLKHISVIRFKQEAAFNFLSISYHQQNKPVQVRFILGGRRYVDLAKGDYARLWPMAGTLSAKLQVPIFRYTGQEKEWLAPGGDEPFNKTEDGQE